MRDPLERADFDARKALRLSVAFIAAMVLLAVLRPSWAGTVAVIFAFFLMIMLHELGHFVMAKKAGMKVTEFFVGFGPRIWSVRRGETEYGLKAIPLGGYCKIIGLTNLEDVAPEDEPRTYRAKSYPRRMSVILAGSAMHFLIAGMLMYPFLLGAGDFRSIDDRIVGEVVAKSPAVAAGIEKGDRLVSFDGAEIDDFEGLVERVAAEKVGHRATLVVERDGALRTLQVTLAPHPDVPGRPFVGVSPSNEAPSVGVLEGLYLAPLRTLEFGRETLVGFGRVFSPSGLANYWEALTTAGEPADTGTEPAPGTAPDAQAPDGDRIVSVVGFGRLANQAVNDGWTTVLGLLIMINLSVGLINLAPLLPFDGGHAAIATYEAVMSRIRGRRVRVDVAKLMPATVVVIALLGFLFLSSVFLDIADPVGNPF